MEITVGPVSDLEPGSVTVIAAGERQIAVFSTGDGLYALDNTCAHRGGPLAEGLVAAGVVTCPWHWWRYQLTTGRRLGSETIGVAVHLVSVRDGMVVVEVPDSIAVSASMRDRLLEHARDWEGRE